MTVIDTSHEAVAEDQTGNVEALRARRPELRQALLALIVT